MQIYVKLQMLLFVMYFLWQANVRSTCRKCSHLDASVHFRLLCTFCTVWCIHTYIHTYTQTHAHWGSWCELASLRQTVTQHIVLAERYINLSRAVWL